jgi:hypothetical protein
MQNLNAIYEYALCIFINTLKDSFLVNAFVLNPFCKIDLNLSGTFDPAFD